jgi:hypothetical protein
LSLITFRRTVGQGICDMSFLSPTLQRVQLGLTEVCNLEGARKLARNAISIIVPENITGIDVSMTSILFPVALIRSMIGAVEVASLSFIGCRTCRATNVALFAVERLGRGSIFRSRRKCGKVDLLLTRRPWRQFIDSSGICYMSVDYI